MLELPRLETFHDDIEEAKGEDELREWLNGFLVAEVKLSGTAEHIGYAIGSFNMAYRYRFDDDGPDAMIRFPKRGRMFLALRDGKVASDVLLIE